MNDFSTQFVKMSTDELIDTFNAQVGNPGWVSSRARHDMALRDELLRRDLDCSSFVGANTISFQSRIHRVGNRLEPLPTNGGETGVQLATAKHTVVIGIVPSVVEGDCLVAVPHDEAVGLAQLHRAIAAAETWGDFRHDCGDLLPKEIDEIAVSLADERFDPLAIPGYADAVWPPCPREFTPTWFPDSVLELARFQDLPHDPDAYEFPVNLEATLIDALEEAGFVVIRDDSLVRAACGSE